MSQFPAKYILRKNFFYQLNFTLSIPFSCDQDQGRYGQAYCTTYWVMSQNWKLFIKKTLQLGKNCKFSFWPKCFHRVLLYRKSSSKNSTNNCRENLFHTNKCNYMSLNLGMERPVFQGNGHVFPCCISNSDLFWNCLNSMVAQTLVYPKTFFFCMHSAWTKVKIPSYLFKACSGVLWYM